MNALRRILFRSLCCVPFCIVLYAQTPTEKAASEGVLRDHVEFLNELSDRRRLNTFFPNEQSVFYGVPIRYVNSSRGNLTFVRRDLVTVGRIPIVLARVYDSSVHSDSDFGPGWRLSLAETISRSSDGTLSYVDDSASELTLILQGGSYVLVGSGPTDIASVDARGDAMRITHRSGWIKEFTQIDGRFRLTAIHDPYGNTLKLRYSGKKLSRIEGQNGRFVAIERYDSGRVRRVTDDQRREVSYVYDHRGQLETVTDLGGHRWRHEYDAVGHLQRVIDPRDVTIVESAFDSKHRARMVQILGAEYHYDYQEGGTLITDEARRVTRVSHNRYGMATVVTNPNGFTSEVLLDQHNRVKTLLHNGTLRAAATYDSVGSVDTLTRFGPDGPIEPVKKPDDGGQSAPLARTHDAALIRGDDSGDPLRKKAGEETSQYEYSPQGDLRSVMQGGERTVHTHNADGQIESIETSRGTTKLSYFPNGKLKSIQFPDGALHEFRYNALGFRERIERSDGTLSTYEYDAAGNLIRADGHQHNAHSPAGGQAYDINDYNQPETIRYAGGDTLVVTYDASGNPETITTSDPQVPALEYLYDHTDRIVAVQDGESISGSYIYEDTEPDLRIQLDDGTMRVASDSVRQSASIGDLLSIVYARPYGSLLDAIRFDEATRTFDLPSDFEVSRRDAVSLNSLTRRKLSTVSAGDAEGRIVFDRPSNVIFVPPEYATINCVQPCTFNGVVVKGNGTSGSITVQQGTWVELTATKAAGSSCQNLLCGWTKNGLPIGGPTINSLWHTFSSLGTFQVAANCECLPCDKFGTGYLTVNVTSTPPPNCGTTGTLQTTTTATVPTNTARTNLGVGEKTNLKITPPPNCPVTWALTAGNGTLAPTGSKATFTAHDRASTATVRATVNGVQRSVTYNVAEPASESAVKLSEDPIPAGTQGAGMILKITIAPTDVSFQNVESREVPGPATNITGYFTDFAPATLAHSPAGWIPIGPGNVKNDHAAISGYPSPWRFGGFQWVIPIQWRVIGSTYTGTLPNRVQTFTINDSSGSTTVTKLGVSVTRSP